VTARRALATLGAIGAAALVAARAYAHEVGLSRGEYVVEGATVKAQVVFARKELSSLVAGLDADHDGALTSAEVTAARGSIEGVLVPRIVVKGDGAPCPGTLERAELTEQDGVAIHSLYRCRERPRELAVTLTFLDDLPFGHRHLARASAGAASIDRVLSQRSPTLSLAVPAEATPPPRAASPLARGALQVLTRYEEPAFLLALLATCGSLRAALLAAVAFVGAAAVGLVVGARGIFVPGPLALGIAVALSLVYVGLDALASPDPERRWRVALPFGVVHGLACASAFQAFGAAGELRAFGAGVAAALAAVIAALLTVTQWALRRPAFAARDVKALGAAIAATGAIGLFIGRT
jgi:hypothetical protein